MPNFNAIKERQRIYERAAQVWHQLVATYNDLKQVQRGLDLYTVGTDEEFNEAVDLLFTLAERQELNQMLSQIDALLTDWETNHAEFLNLAVEEEGP